MRIPRIYTPQPLASDSIIELEEAPSHHLLKVLRMEVGRKLVVFNGSGGEYDAEISLKTKKAATISLTTHRNTSVESPLQTHLAISLSRGDRFELVLQKATELGVSEFTPILSERTEFKFNQERLPKKSDSWKKIIIGACEQSGRTKIPLLNPVLTLNEFCSKAQASSKFVLHHRSSSTLKNSETPRSVILLIGPEGGLSESEIEYAMMQGFQALTIGPRVMRTETAPIAALSIMQSLWGDL